VFDGHKDYEESFDKVCEVVKKMGLDNGRWGLEKHSLFSPLQLGEGIQKGLPHANWGDASYLIDELRLTKSPLELECVREASRIGLAMMRSVLVEAREGITEREIAAEVSRAMIQAGGEYPGFGPFIRSTPTMPQEHVTWTNYQLKRGDVLFVELTGCFRRYHAPMGRLFFVGEAPEGIDKAAEICKRAFDAVVAAIKPGVTAGEAYKAWQDVVDRAGLAHYQRHHCGYMVGVGFPPSWVGGSRVVGLRRDSPMVLKEGMTFHLLSWLVGSGIGDYLITDTACLTDKGCEALQKFPTGVQVI
jgi:Xaa-Pro dipeptidase